MKEKRDGILFTKGSFRFKHVSFSHKEMKESNPVIKMQVERNEIEDSHSLVGIYDAEFDQGECTGFILVEIRPAEDVKSKNSIERR